MDIRVQLKTVSIGLSSIPPQLPGKNLGKRGDLDRPAYPKKSFSHYQLPGDPSWTARSAVFRGAKIVPSARVHGGSRSIGGSSKRKTNDLSPTTDNQIIPSRGNSNAQKIIHSTLPAGSSNPSWRTRQRRASGFQDSHHHLVASWHFPPSGKGEPLPVGILQARAGTDGAAHRPSQSSTGTMTSPKSSSPVTPNTFGPTRHLAKRNFPLSNS